MEGRALKIKGLVIPSRWDEKGAVTAVIIASRDETEYQVEMASSNKGLIGLLHRMVEIEGEIDSNGMDRPVVKIVKFWPVDTWAPEIGLKGELFAPKK